MDTYIYQADIYCEECAQKISNKIMVKPEKIFDTRNLKGLSSDEFPHGPFPNGGGEADTPQHCGNCGLFLENALTGDGECYVRARIKFLKEFRSKEGLIKIEVVNELYKWEVFYGYLFEDQE